MKRCCEPAVIRGYFAFADHEIGRVIQHVEDMGRRHYRMHAKQIAPRTFFGLEPPIERNQALS
jgi:hypothetical protein